MKELAKKALPDILVVVGFVAIALLYFFTPLSQGLVLGGHDTIAGMGQGHEQELFHQATGETSRWTGSIFSGMPTYQISPSYGPTQLLGKVGYALGLFTTGPLRYLLAYLLGFYLLMRAFNLRPAISALGSTLWAFSSYFFIIIAAGHIWKVNTLAYIPPTIAGLVLAYRGKYLWGALVTALFTALQVLSNHIQMTYYFLFLMAFITIAYGVEAALKKQWRHWAKATAAIAIGGLLGAAINLPNLYHTWQYTHESMRGPAALTAAPAHILAAAPDATPATPDATPSTGGLDRDYITAWSYGIDETLTLLIPMYKGGGSSNIYDRPDAQQLKGFDDFNEHAAAIYQATQGQMGYLPGTSQYWGEQPFTVGPVYVGAIVCFLFILGLFIVRGPMKWALLAATILSLIFAWGRNIMPVTDMLIDHLPMYNKFRTVSSALVVAELTMPLLAVLALAEVIRQRSQLLTTRRGQAGVIVSLLLTAGTSLLFAIHPSLADCISGQDMTILEQFKQAGIPFDFCEGYRAAIVTMHENILATSALRSFLLIFSSAFLIFVYIKRPKALPAPALIAAIFIISLLDMWNVNKDYLNDSNFQSEGVRLEGFSKTPADQRILQDTDPDYRVVNLATGNPFNESDNHTAYWHKSVGGYHAAKLHRYQDLIDGYLDRECRNLSAAINDTYSSLAERDSTLLITLSQDALLDTIMAQVTTDSICPVLNMLNTRWIITGPGANLALRNSDANGNAWYVEQLHYVDTPDAEYRSLSHLDLKRQAVATLDQADILTRPAARSAAPGTIRLTDYQPNELRYEASSKESGVVVFSEIYYPGWTATIDGEPASLGRANYILRALAVPAGRHEIVLTFRPTSVALTNGIAYGALALLAFGFIFLGYCEWKRRQQ